MRKWLIGLVLGLSLFGGVAHAENAKDLKPDPDHVMVTDHAGVLDRGTYQKVYDTKKELDKFKEKPQIAVLTVKSSDDEDLSDYAYDLTRNGHWHVGDRKENNGVLIIFAQNKGKNNVYIATGSGAERYLTDSQTQDILQKYKHDLKSKDTDDVNKGLQGVVNDTKKATVKYYKIPADKRDDSVMSKVTITFLVIIISVGIVIFAIVVFLDGHDDNHHSDDGSDHNGHSRSSDAKRHDSDVFIPPFIPPVDSSSDTFFGGSDSGFGGFDGGSFGGGDFGGGGSGI